MNGSGPPSAGRSKRKSAAFSAADGERPHKHHRGPALRNGKQSAGDSTPEASEGYALPGEAEQDIMEEAQEEDDDDMMADEDADDYVDEQDRLQQAGALLPTAAGPDTAEWQATIQNVVRNVVSIRFCQTSSFDTDPALTSEATGFVVDAERGYVAACRSFPDDHRRSLIGRARILWWSRWR